MQSFTDKCEAIISLLEFLWFHLDFVPGRLKTQPQKWVSEPSPLDEPAPPLVPVNVDCKGHCFTCLAHHQTIGKVPICPPEEKWVREVESLRRKYRIADLEDSLLRLGRFRDKELDGAQAAQAVWAVYVDPWPGEPADPKRPAFGTRTEMIPWGVRGERARLAEEGIKWMAHDVRGDIKGYNTTTPTLEEQAASLVADGIRSPSVIAQRLQCSVRHAKRLKALALARYGDTAFAPG